MFVSIGSRAGRNRRRWGVRPVYDGNGSLVVPSMDILGSHHIWDAAGASRMTFDVGGNVQGGQQMNGSILFGPTNNGYRLGMVCHNGGIGFQGFAATTNDGGLKGQRWAYGTDFAYINSSALNFPSAPYYISWSSDTYLGRRGIATLQLGLADAAAPVAQTLAVQSVVAGTTNTAGADFTIAGSQGTGTGAGGSIVFKTAPAGSSGTAQNALASALTIGAGDTTLAPGSGIINLTGNAFSFGSTTLSVKIGSNGSATACMLWSIGGNSYFRFDPNSIQMNMSIGWGGGGVNYNTSNDTCLNRNSAGIVEINNGTTGTYRDLKLRNLIFSDGTQLATSPARTLLTTITPTAVASIAYTSIPSGYSKFEIEFDNVTNNNGGANEAPLVALSANNGTTYDSYQVGAANTGLSGAMYSRFSIAPVNVTANKIAEGAATQGTTYWQLAGRWISQTGPTNAIRFAWSLGGNFVAQGSIRIYGIV